MNKKDIQFVLLDIFIFIHNKITCLVSIFSIYHYWHIEVVNFDLDI